jgi:hypothetical protein
LKNKNDTAYELKYRDIDGYIDITNLCKAGGKLFGHYRENKKTQSFLQVLSSDIGIPISELIKLGTGSNHENSQTWAHPQVAINIAQWISPQFDVLVSKWVYEIMITGKVDARINKTTKELDIMNKEMNKYRARIKLLESKVLQRQKRETFDENTNVVYVVTTEYKESQNLYKIGKTKDLQKRLSTYNTTEKHEVVYNTSCQDSQTMNLLEKMVHKKLNKYRVEPNHEWFKSEEDDCDFFIKTIEECKKYLDL